MAEIKVTIDLNFKFKDPKGEPLKSNGVEIPPANEIVGNFLFNGHSTQPTDKLRNSSWALELYKTGKIDVDKRSMDSILASCAGGGMADGVYCQLDEYFTSKKEEWDKLKVSSN